MTSRPRIAGPLLLALVFLAIIGASVGVSVGYYLAGPGEDGGGGNGGQTQGPPTQQPPTPDETDSPAPERGCPAVTQAAAVQDGARGQLQLELYIRTRFSQVWICRDRADRLWYQGHRLTGEATDNLPAATSGNTLFLSEVEQFENGYVATNRISATRTTYYRVTRTQLRIDNPGTVNDSAQDALPEYTYPAK